MTTSLVAVVTDVVRDGRRVVGYGFNSNGRYGQGGLIRERFRDRILDIYSKRGFASIDPADLRGRFRWMGLYTQRRPGLDGGKTATLEPEELEDEFFMMRIRTDGTVLGADALRTIGAISTEFARGTADITDRQNVQLHWVDIRDVPEIWDRL
ncbi:MAG: hypothetical protein ACLGHY_14960, partial [Gammaproteobacteria bacterium]